MNRRFIDPKTTSRGGENAGTGGASAGRRGCSDMRLNRTYSIGHRPNSSLVLCSCCCQSGGRIGDGTDLLARPVDESVDGTRGDARLRSNCANFCLHAFDRLLKSRCKSLVRYRCYPNNAHDIINGSW